MALESRVAHIVVKGCSIGAGPYVVRYFGRDQYSGSGYLDEPMELLVDFLCMDFLSKEPRYLDDNTNLIQLSPKNGDVLMSLGEHPCLSCQYHRD